MTGIIHFETFLITGILLNLTPGNDTIFILSKSVGQGKKAGIISVLGIGTGSVVHTLLAAFGLSVIIAQSMLLFNLIKYAGAAYIFYIGYRMLSGKAELDMSAAKDESKVNYRKIYRDGVITNVLNPKVALFFIAFLPQFIDPSAGHTVIPFLALGFTFITTGLIWSLVLAGAAAFIFAGLKRNQKAAAWINRICGLTLIGLGIKVAFTERK